MTTTVSKKNKSLAKLADKELIRRFEALSGKEREITLSVLLYLIEIDRRRLYLSKGYSSLFDYCVRHFRYSESSAVRRIRTARCMRDFPEIYGMLSRGELNLCTVSRISSILTEDNKDTLLPEVMHRSTRDVETIVSRHNPESCSRDRVRAVYIKRYIPDSGVPGEEDTVGGGTGSDASCTAAGAGAGASIGAAVSGTGVDTSCDAAAVAGNSLSGSGIPVNWGKITTSAGGEKFPANADGEKFTTGAGGEKFPANADGEKFNTSSCGGTGDAVGGGGVTADGTPGDGEHKSGGRVILEKRIKLEFTVAPELMEKLDSVRSLLSTRYPRGLGFERLLEILTDEYLDRHGPEGRMRRRAEREAKKNAPAGRSQGTGKTRHKSQLQGKESAHGCKGRRPVKDKSVITSKPPEKDGPLREKSHGPMLPGDNNRSGKQETHQANLIDNKHRAGRKKSRLIPQAVRDEVFTRDGGRCTYVGEGGKRCNSPWNPQIDHIVPYARGGGNTADNLRLLCADHNELEAERAYGKEFMKRFRQRE